MDRLLDHLIAMEASQCHQAWLARHNYHDPHAADFLLNARTIPLVEKDTAKGPAGELKPLGLMLAYPEGTWKELIDPLEDRLPSWLKSRSGRKPFGFPILPGSQLRLSS